VASAEPDGTGTRVVILSEDLPGGRVRLIEAVGEDLWRGSDEAGAEVTVVLGAGGTPRDRARAHGRDGADLVAVYDGPPGPTLARLLAGEEPLPADRARSLSLDLTAAVASAHRSGIVHGDLRPARVLVGPPLRLVGAGLTGRGNPAYGAPEVALGEPVGAPADVYSTCAMIYELLSGRPPFEGKTAAEIISAQLVREPKPLGELAPDAPTALAEVVARGLAKREADRPTIHEVEHVARAAAAEPDLIKTPPLGTRPVTGPRPGLVVRPLEKPVLPAIRAPKRTVGDDFAATPLFLPAVRPSEPRAPVRRRGPLLVTLALVVLGVLAIWLIVRPARAPGPSLSLPPLDAELEGRIDLARQRGDLAAARTEAEAFARSHPEDAAAFALLGHVLFAQGEKDRALAAYRAALRMDRAFGAAPELLANLRATFADPQRGEAAFKLAEEIGAPAEPILADLGATTASGPLKRRAAEAAGKIAARKGDPR